MSYPQSELDYKELVNNLIESYNDCGSANNLSVPPFRNNPNPNNLDKCCDYILTCLC